MAKKYRWPEKLFFRLELNEKKCWLIIAGLFFLLILGQILLTDSTLRRYLVLTETYEGKPAKFYQTLKD